MMRSFPFVALMMLVAASPAFALGPFEIQDSDSSASLRFQLAVQLQTAWQSEDRGAHEDRREDLTTRVRRIRPTLTLRLPEHRMTFRLHLSTAPGSLELMDVYVNVQVAGAHAVRMGQYKIPFTRYRIQSLQRLTFADWSLVTRYFGAERQYGISIHNGYERPPRIGYVIGVFSGVNARASHAIGLPSLYGETLPNPSDLTGSSTRTRYHPEFAAHLSYNTSAMDVSTDSDAEGGHLRVSVASSVAWDLDPEPYHDFDWRFAQELLLKYRHWSWMGAGYVGLVDVSGQNDIRWGMAGVLAQATYRPHQRWGFAVRYACVDINDDMGRDARLRAWELNALAEDEAIRAGCANAGQLLAVHEGTFGVDYYLDGHNLKWQHDIGFTRRVELSKPYMDYLIRSQVQVGF